MPGSSTDIQDRPRTMPDAATVALRRAVRDFLDDERATGGFVPSVDSWLAGFDPAFSRKLGRRGWIGMTWPQRFGGGGLSNLARFAVIEELLAAGAPVAAHWFADRQIGPALIRYGTPGQQDRFLPPIVRGECYFAVGLSEPDSGSDLASVRTRATPQPDGGWLLSGTKVWTSGAHRAHFMVALCRSHDRTDDGRQGLTQFIVDLTAPGVTVRPIHLLNGAHHFNEVQLDDVRVGADAVLGQAGQGWAQVSAELAFERSGPERFLSAMPLLAAYLASGAPLDSRAEATVGSLAAELWSVRQLSLGVAASMDTGEAPGLDAILVKDVGTRLEQRMIEDVRSLIGAGPSTRLAGLLRDAVEHAPGFTLRGGTNEVLRTIVAKGLGL